MSVIFFKGADVIHLPNPEFGDSETLGLRAPAQVSMDGSFYTYIKTPITRALNLSFVDLTRKKMEAFITWLTSNQGNEVTFVDLLGVTWSGFITTDPNELTTDGRGRGTSELRESGSISLVFEGAPV